jgi:hypothetical protein
MNADKLFVFQSALSAFIGGWLFPVFFSILPDGGRAGCIDPSGAESRMRHWTTGFERDRPLLGESSATDIGPSRRSVRVARVIRTERPSDYLS